jgi:hypothetical protein
MNDKDRKINISELQALGDYMDMYTVEYDGSLLVILDIKGGENDGCKFYYDLDPDSALHLGEAIQQYLAKAKEDDGEPTDQGQPPEA